MSHLILVRHGQSEWNLENRFTGWVDDADNADFTAAGIPCLVRFTTHFNADSLGIVVGTPATTGV